MLYELFGTLLFTVVVGVVAVGLVIGGISLVDRLDGVGAARRTSAELFGGQTRLRRFGGWCLWAAPAVVVACGVAGALWGGVVAVIGGAAALVNMAGIALMLRETELGSNGRRGLIVLGWFQVPVGVMRIVAEGM